jgi:hypothetical protein
MPDGEFWMMPDEQLERVSKTKMLGGKIITIVLTTAHLDHDPTNCDLENLRHWCQLHHLRYDGQHHADTARKTREANERERQPLLGGL